MVRSEIPWPNLSRTTASSPHSTGAGIPEGAMNLAKVLNICPTNPSARPISHGDCAPGTAHSQQLASHQFWPRSKHSSDQTRDNIKAGVLKRESFGIAFHE